MSRPWMPLYVADYLADTGHLSTFEHGAYMLLIMHYWSKGSLPDDNKRLASIARASLEQWSDIRATLAEFFGDGWKHERIDDELEKSAKAYERRATAGKAGGLAKAEKSSNARAKPQQSLSHIIEIETRARQFEEVWAVYPRKAGKVPARKAFNAALNAADFPTILAGAERYAAERAGQDRKFTKHATTWFNGQHWQDEPEPVHQAQPRAQPPPKKVNIWIAEGRERGILNDPANTPDRRLETGHGGGSAQGSNLARRITIAGTG